MSIGRIDAHQHYWSLAHHDYGWLQDTPELHAIHRDFAPEDLAPLLDDADIDATVLVQAAPSEAETARLLGIAADPASRVRAVVGWTDLAADDAPRRISRLAQEPLIKGLRPMLQDLPDPEWILDARLEPAIRTMTELGLCLDLLIKPHQIDAATKFALRHPLLPMVIDHGAKPDIAHGRFEPWASQIAILAQCTRVSCKLSGLATEAGADWDAAALRPYVDHLIDRFGPLRLMWGSDWPVLNLAGTYGRWQAASLELLAGLSPLEQEQILGTNAATFYGIK
ncbi:amidohydrolase family protein [Variovorax ureilyticus]|uniref:Amidohydrolase family protein n=1 Tax=Variovorax ureilyticus TaxID=1836198 RepID=A0ABU8VFV6_9BURK